MANFLRSGPDNGVRNDNSKAGVGRAGAPNVGEPATTVRLIKLSKAANDNPVPFAARLRWWAPLALVIVAAVVWQFLR
ncbi:MAG TPA: hypothetical protein VGO34_03250 [Alphaproteobacteria bacterium]|jgi:hypothetical protein